MYPPSDPAVSPRRAANAATACVVETLESRRLLSVDITVTTSKHAQTIDGFGTSLGGTPSQQQVEDKTLQKVYYSDLGSSILRVDLTALALRPAGGSYAKPISFSQSLQHNVGLFDFNQYQIKVAGTLARGSLKYALDSTKVIASIWSPPQWMKGQELNPQTGKGTGVYPKLAANGISSGGSLIDTEANLTQFARYVAAYVQGFQQAYGVPIYALSIQNELAFHEWYSSCVYTPQIYVDAVKAVSRWFKLYGIKTKLIGPEDVGVGSTSAPYVLNRQFSYINALRKDRDAFAAISGYAIHGYANDGVTPSRSPEMWQQYENGRTGYPSWTGIAGDDKFSWMTETSGGTNTWGNALNMAENVQDALVKGNVSAWVYWGITPASPINGGFTLTTGNDITANRYVAAKHFFHFIRPGAQRVRTDSENPSGVYASAYVQDAQKTLTSVIINTTTKTQTVDLHLPGVSLDSFDSAYLSYSGKLFHKLKPIAITDGIATFSLPPQSIITLQGKTGTVRKPGAIVGTYFNDTSLNGVQDHGETGLAGDKIFIDSNNNGLRDAGEAYTVARSDGSFSFVNLSAGTYRVRREVPAGWRWTTARPNVVVVSGKTSRGIVLGVAKVAQSSRLGSIAGNAFNDTNKNGIFDNGDTIGADKTIYLDANNNGLLDGGEAQVHTNSQGNFDFTNLSAGTYHVRRLFYTGFRSSTPIIDLTLTEGQDVTGVLIGSKAV